MPFPFYRRLTPRQKGIYRASAAIATVAVPRPAAARRLVGPVRDALESEDRRLVLGAVTDLLGELTSQLGVPSVRVRVLNVRPSSASAELHGLYERAPGEPAILRVWMRTAVHARVVSFRTFLRTVLHELCHHLDYELYELADSYHTEGFFQRESSLTRILAPRPSRPRGAAPVPAVAAAESPAAAAGSASARAPGSRRRARRSAAPAQLELPLTPRS